MPRTLPLTSADARRLRFEFLASRHARPTSDTPSKEKTPEQQRKPTPLAVEERRERGREQWAARKAEREETKVIADALLADRTVPLFVEDRKQLLEEAERVRKATKDVATGMAEVLAGCRSPFTGRAIGFSEQGERERTRPR